MKSSIDRAGEPAQLRVPGNREFCAGRARRRGREALWARQVFTLISTALALRERLALPHREGLCQWAVARFINTPHTPHPQREVRRPQPEGEKNLGAFAPTLPGRAAPHVMALRCATLPPEASAVGGKSPGPGREVAASRGSLLWEKQGPFPGSTSASQGAPGSLTAGREGQAAGCLDGQRDFLPQGHRQCRPE